LGYPEIENAWAGRAVFHPLEPISTRILDAPLRKRKIASVFSSAMATIFTVLLHGGRGVEALGRLSLLDVTPLGGRTGRIHLPVPQTAPLMVARMRVFQIKAG